MRRLTPLTSALALCAALASASATAADIMLANAWMRPAPAGASSAKVYVDITSDAPLELVGASTPAARRTDLVRVLIKDTTIDEQVVKSLPVAAGTPTRLAFNGDHLRLSGIVHDVGNGVPVPLTLVFKDRSGKTVNATTDVLVRGLLRPGQMSGSGTRTMPAPEAPMVPKLPQPPPKM